MAGRNWLLLTYLHHSVIHNIKIERFVIPVIRNAVPEEARAIAEMHVRAWRAAYKNIIDDKMLAELDPVEQAGDLTDPGSGYLVTPDKRVAVFVAEDGGTITGWVSVGPARDKNFSEDAELYAIYVDPDHLNKGIGTQLFNAAARHVTDQGFNSIYVDVLAANQQGCCFYERMGAQNLPEATYKVTLSDKRYKVARYYWPFICPS